MAGRSADLLFTLATLRAVMHHLGCPELAATGKLDDDGRVHPVDHVPAKLEAAIALLPAGAWAFYPEGNEGEISVEVKRAAAGKGVHLRAVGRLEEAARALGIPVTAVWLEPPWLGLAHYRPELSAVVRNRAYSSVD